MFKLLNLNVLQTKWMDFFNTNLFKINRITFHLEIRSERIYLINSNSKSYSNKNLKKDI
jgi:hypothetical protein